MLIPCTDEAWKWGTQGVSTPQSPSTCEHGYKRANILASHILCWENSEAYSTEFISQFLERLTTSIPQ